MSSNSSASGGAGGWRVEAHRQLRSPSANSSSQTRRSGPRDALLLVWERKEMQGRGKRGMLVPEFLQNVTKGTAAPTSISCTATLTSWPDIANMRTPLNPQVWTWWWNSVPSTCSRPPQRARQTGPCWGSGAWVGAGLLGFQLAARAAFPVSLRRPARLRRAINTPGGKATARLH